MPPLETNWTDIAIQRFNEKKTHVTFPQLKYPSLRDKGTKDPVQWLAGKAMDDGAEGFWRVHNKLYDLTSFLNKHPGGAEWLELTKGTDITEAFESHHFNPAVEKLLEDFYIKDATTPRNSPFTFEENGFYKILKKAVIEEIKNVPKDTYKLSDRITDILFISLLCSSILPCWVQNYWGWLFCSICASINLCFLTIACHNYIHRRTNFRMYLFNLSMWSYRDFRVSHALSHHLYTNTLMDLEISALEPLIYYIPRTKKPILAKYPIFAIFLFFPLIFVLSFTRRFLLIFIRPDFFQKHYRWHDGICFLLPLWMWLMSGAPLIEVLSSWFIIVCMGSFAFYVIGVNAAHFHPDAIKDGDEPRTESPDWGVHQIEALVDRKDVNSNIFTILIMFGEHTLHHLFPTLDHAVLKHLHPLVVKLAEKYQADYKTSTQFGMVIAQLKEASRTEFKTLKDKKAEK